MILRTFGWSFAITILGVALGFIYGGTVGLVLVLILCVLEISLSFDNAVVNATVIERMSPFWQRMFLTVGILIAVVGMRLVFPLVVVGVTARLNPAEAVSLALEKGDPATPGSYGFILHEAHPSIAAFGGMFLLMLFLSFIFEERDIRWLRWIEAPLAKVGRLESASVLAALGVLLLVTAFVATEQSRVTVLVSGIVGVALFLLINALGKLFEDTADDVTSSTSGTAKVVGKAAFFLFLYLEVLDASFSFDGVIGAFAITTDPVLIALGLGVGAIYIRSITILLVRKGSLREFRYLEHGALWAVGALAVILLVTIRWEIPEVVTGLIGVVFIAAGWISSIAHNRLEAKAAAPVAG